MNVSRRLLLRRTGAFALGAFLTALAAACGASPTTNESPLPGAERNGSQEKADMDNRLPPGQHVVNRLPILDLGIRPDVSLDEWSLDIGGHVENPVRLTWVEFQNLPHVEKVWDWHCVTGWSKFDVRVGGVPFGEIVKLVRPRDGTTSVIFESRDGYTSNTPYQEMLDKESLLADQLDGQALPLEHGGPMRGFIPWLYAWKSAKFLSGIRFQTQDESGYWETRGYHNHADPWNEERFGGFSIFGRSRRGGVTPPLL